MEQLVKQQQQKWNYYGNKWEKKEEGGRETNQTNKIDMLKNMQKPKKNSIL